MNRDEILCSYSYDPAGDSQPPSIGRYHQGELGNPPKDLGLANPIYDGSLDQAPNKVLNEKTKVPWDEFLHDPKFATNGVSPGLLDLITGTEDKKKDSVIEEFSILPKGFKFLPKEANYLKKVFRKSHLNFDRSLLERPSKRSSLAAAINLPNGFDVVPIKKNSAPKRRNYVKSVSRKSGDSAPKRRKLMKLDSCKKIEKIIT